LNFKFEEGGILMRKQIFILFITLMMISTSIVFIPNITIVRADANPPGNDGYNVLNTTYIKEITQNLSNIIKFSNINWEYDIPKGRAFGTAGERYAANNIIGPQMIDINLWNVTKDKMENISNKKGGNLTHKLEITSRGLSINHSGTIIDVSEFYIAPRWNYTGLFDSDLDETERDLLTHNFSYENQELKIVRRPKFPWFGYVVGKYIGSLIEGKSVFEIAEINTLNNLSALTEFLMNKFEEEYNFSWDNSTGIGPDNESLPWYNESIACINQPFVCIDEDPTFNPDTYKPEILQTLKKISPLNQVSLFYNRLRFYIQLKLLHLWSECRNNDHFKGLILYDHNNDTYNMANWRMAVPIIYMNRTLGQDIYDDTTGSNWESDEYTVKFHINQSYNENVESYNVMGEINGTNSKKTVIVCSYYDSWWNQGVVDGAIPMSTVLAIAKYMRELNETYGIEPKYNVKFIGFGGEEYGYVGAYYYVKNYTKKNIKTVIDLNQLGFIQNDPPHHLDLNIGVDKLLLCPLIKSIIDNSNYPERLDDGTDSKVSYMPYGIPANVFPFATRKYFTYLPRSSLREPHTIGFLKDTNWTRHHRDGLNHEEGDTMKYWYGKDVNLSGEMIWNVTKYFTINPDCWFTGAPSYDFWDSNDQNSYYDTVNVSFSLDTIMPRERVSVRLVVHPNSTENPALSLLYRHRACKQFDVTPDGITGYINTTLPNHFPKGKYDVMIYLCNSSGDANLGWFDCLYWNATGKDLLSFCKTFLGHDLLSWEYFSFRDIILKISNLDIIDFLTRLTDVRPVRDLLKDLFGYYCYSENNSKYSTFMAPPNDPPVKPDTPTDIGKLGGFNLYRTKTTDPDEGAKIRYQWEWNGTKGFPTFRCFNSGQYHREPHLWLNDGQKTIRVRAKNYRNPNYYSPWSEYLNISVSAFCFYNTQTSQTSQNNINNPYIQNSYDQDIVVVNQETTFKGYSYGFSQSPTPKFVIQGFDDQRAEWVISENFSEVGTRYVNFTANSGGLETFYNRTINIVNISPCFSMNQLGAQPNLTINFTDTTISNRTIDEWLWNFGDGCTNTSQNTYHSFNTTGVYNVSLNVTDINNESATFWQIVYVESNPPDIIATQYLPTYGGTLGCNITLSTEFFDNNESGVESVSVNISYPNGITNNFTMYENENSSYGYEYIFNDTMQVGWYYYTIWVTDYAKNTNSFAGCGFEILPAFGYSTIGNLSKNIMNNISGSNFTILVNGTAQSITALIHTNQTTAPKTKCMIYRVNDSQLVGTTEEKTYNTGNGPDWVTYNFTGTKPNLITNTSYVIACWSNNTCNLYYDNATDDKHGKYNETIYGSPPSNIEWTDEPRLYSIYCTYTTTPEVKSVTASPDPIGFGFNTTITAEIEHYYTFVENITINITYPNNSFINNSMTKVDDDTFQYIFNDAWKVGQYNYSIWVKDKLEASSTSTGYSFNVSAGATIKVCTIKDSYSNNQTVNLTDPPIGATEIGYELLDNNSVLHIWNPFNSYYFNTSSGIQLTNHYDEYWSHNVLMLGYYNNNKWNLIYRTDELSGFNKNVSTDNETFVNATLWKDLTYKGYDFRLAIRYNLGVDDNALTVIPYIKNLGDAIPYNLAFGWEIKDIKIANTFENDTIRLYNGTNWTNYSLNQTLNNTYNDMDYNTTFILEGLNEDEFFRRTLYLKWDHNLDYLKKKKNRTGQHNAPVTLFIKIGTLSTNQEKYTVMNWLDSDEWLGVDSRNYNSCCGYEGPFGPSAALDGIDVWTHLSTENHWLVIDLSNPYNIKKLRGRSNTANDPTSVDIYISNDPDNWGTAVYSGITSWQDTTSWSEIDITDTAGRYINISITSTEGGAGTDYLEFGGIPVPMTIFDVYGDKLASATYYFSNLTSDSQANTWTTNPYNMVDGSTSTYASTSVDGDVEACTVNNCPGTILGTVMKVEMRAYGYYWTNQRDIILRPVFGGTIDGRNYNYQTAISADWSEWFDITDDDSAPACWNWNDIVNLDCDVESESDMGAFTLYCSKVEIRVTYATIPLITNPVPSDGSDGVSITPTLNITVADIEGDPMNISWLSNSSGSWQIFGTNTSVSNGTYHQVFSNATENGKWWYWKVNVSDNTSYNMSGVYKFYTGHQSKIKNTGSTNIKGYLLMQIEFYNTTNSTWILEQEVINETTTRTINDDSTLALDTIFNPHNVSTNSFTNGNGTYRVYAAFCDPDGDVLVCDDETELYATHQFTVS
jgi:hypothetical protein